jgi:hypothetical protein
MENILGENYDDVNKISFTKVKNQESTKIEE